MPSKRDPAVAKIHTQICSITDPWCSASRGSKYPDDVGSKTMSWAVDQYHTLVSDSTGRAGLFVSANPGGNLSVVATWNGVAPATTGGTSVAPGWSAFNGSGAQWRCVSLGVEVESILSAMNNSGQMGINIIAPDEGPVQILQANFDQPALYVEARRHALNSGTPMCAYSKSNGTEALKFKNPAAGTSPEVNSDGNSVIYIYVTGTAPSTGAVSVRIRAHYELIFPQASLFNQFSQEPAVENPYIKAGKNYVTNKIGSIFVGGVKTFEEAVARAAMDYVERRSGRLQDL